MFLNLKISLNFIGYTGKLLSDFENIINKLIIYINFFHSNIKIKYVQYFF